MTSTRIHVRRMAPLLLSAAVLAAGCNSGFESKDPAADVKNKDLQLNQRQIALEQLWAGVQAGTVETQAAREAFKDLIWKGGAPPPLRQKALALLLADTNPDSMADTRNLLRLRLPTETSWPLVEDICAAVRAHASDPAWKDQTAALVRSYSRKVPSPADPERPERAALLALHPERPLEATIFEVFARPRDNGAPDRPEDYITKASNSAWELLGRLDPDGSQRAAILASRAGGEPALATIERAARELGIVPVTASELSWLKRLIEDKDARNSAWWSSASAAVQGLSPAQRAGLQLRHLEPIRWSAAHQPSWLSLERSALLSELQSRLSGRAVHRKSEELASGETSRETVREWESSLVWGDVLAVMVIDEAVHQPILIEELFKQAAIDSADDSTEHGGVLWSIDEHAAAGTGGAGKEPFLARGYAPRPMQRYDDRTFIAPEEMFADSSRALAHYHFHVQDETNAEYAGPGRADLEYADTHGRSCVVFTSVRAGIMDADYYQRGKVVIDLGEVRAKR